MWFKKWSKCAQKCIQQHLLHTPCLRNSLAKKTYHLKLLLLWLHSCNFLIPVTFCLYVLRYLLFFFIACFWRLDYLMEIDRACFLVICLGSSFGTLVRDREHDGRSLNFCESCGFCCLYQGVVRGKNASKEK